MAAAALIATRGGWRGSVADCLHAHRRVPSRHSRRHRGTNTLNYPGSARAGPYIVVCVPSRAEKLLDAGFVFSLVLCAALRPFASFPTLKPD